MEEMKYPKLDGNDSVYLSLTSLCLAYVVAKVESVSYTDVFASNLISAMRYFVLSRDGHKCRHFLFVGAYCFFFAYAFRSNIYLSCSLNSYLLYSWLQLDVGEEQPLPVLMIQKCLLFWVAKYWFHVSEKLATLSYALIAGVEYVFCCHVKGDVDFLLCFPLSAVFLALGSERYSVIYLFISYILFYIATEIINFL